MVSIQVTPLPGQEGSPTLPNESRYVLEVCADSLDSVAAAVRGGAHRIELCSSLAEGGLTPSAGFIRAARNLSPIPLFVMIRPRSGDFLYSYDEVDTMAADILAATSLGADGVVLGLLTPDGEVDVERTRRLVDAARPLETTFHRAFDLTQVLDRALEDVIRAGASRVLTSGGAATAIDGLKHIRWLVGAARGRIIVMPGSGVRSGNVSRLVASTGATEVHASAKAPVSSRMRFRRDVSMGSPGADEYTRQQTDEAEVRALVQALGKI